jgi:hypothetical protein
MKNRLTKQKREDDMEKRVDDGVLANRANNPDVVFYEDRGKDPEDLNSFADEVNIGKL